MSAHKKQQYLSWVFDIPYLVTEEIIDQTFRFKIIKADDDYQGTYADQEKTWFVDIEAVSEYDTPRDYISELIASFSPASLAIDFIQAVNC